MAKSLLTMIKLNKAKKYVWSLNFHENSNLVSKL